MRCGTGPSRRRCGSDFQAEKGPKGGEYGLRAMDFSRISRGFRVGQAKMGLEAAKMGTELMGMGVKVFWRPI